MNPEVQAVADVILSEAEILVEKMINEHSDEVVAQAMAKLAELIPGKIDDMVIAAMLPELKKVVKVEMLKLAEKISPKV